MAFTVYLYIFSISSYNYGSFIRNIICGGYRLLEADWRTNVEPG